MESRLFLFLKVKEELPGSRHHRLLLQYIQALFTSHHGFATPPIPQPGLHALTSANWSFSSNQKNVGPVCQHIRQAPNSWKQQVNTWSLSQMHQLPSPSQRECVSVCVLTIRKLHTGADLSVNIDHAVLSCSSQLNVVFLFPVCGKVRDTVVKVVVQPAAFHCEGAAGAG